MFVDKAKIYIEAGRGGNGAVSFHREKYVAAGGPDGGDGGKGGNVVFQADRQLSTLMDFRYKKKYKATDGGDGRAANSTGKNGSDIVIKVPCGTVLKNAATGKVIADLAYDEQTFIAAKGGSGGFGNVHFATPTRQVPMFAKPGLAGQSMEVILELKLLADVGLLGFPNVGKSTLLSVISDANPKIANYHFTTLEPNLGVVAGYGESFVVADVPGIIEGAHEGVGLGHEFLRHIERTRLLVHVVDVSGIEGRNPVEDFDTINSELFSYSEKLADKEQIIAANKTDLGLNPELAEEFTAEMKNRGYTVFEISAATNRGVKELMQYVSERLTKIPKMPEIEIEEDVSEIRPENDSEITVTKDGAVFVVEGGYIEYLVNSTNFTDTESLQFFQNALRRKGIVDLLEKAGVKEGDTVRMCDLEFDFVY